jgi:peptidoglycan/LPS O-acetylase OafA/YrhL
VTTLAAESPRAAVTAPDALAPPPGNPRFPLMDGLRAIAAMSIVVTHCSGLTGFNTANALGAYTARLNAGVAMFFVLSGFLLYRPFLAARFEGRPRPRIRDYARRRLLRIVPAYWLALTVLAATVGLPGVFTGDWYVYYGFLQVYSPNWILGGIGPAWSLCVEMSFYVALPVIALGLARLQRGRRRETMIRIEAAALGGLALAALAFRTWLHADDPTSVLQSTLLCNLDWFCAGMGLALASVASTGREEQGAAARLLARRAWPSWAAAAAVLWVMSTRLGLPRGYPPFYDGAHWLAEHVLYITFGTLLALPAVFGDPRDGAIRRLLGHPVLSWLGLVSYGVFLWHAPLLVNAWQNGAGDVLPFSLPFVSSLLVTAASATACAALSYYLVERPILRFKDRGRRPPPASASRTGAVGEPGRVPATAG